MKSHCYPSGWQARLGMIADKFMNKIPFSLACSRPGRKRDYWRCQFFRMLFRGSFHACYLGYSIGQKWQGKGLMFEALTAAIRYMQRTQHIHRIMANYCAQ